MEVNEGTSFFSFLAQLITSLVTFLFWTIIVSAIVFLAYRLITKWLFLKRTEKQITRNNLTFLHIKISSRNEQKESAMEDFLRALHRTLPNNTQFSLEIASQQQFLKFYVAIPKEYKNILESQLYAQYSDAEIEEVEDYLPKLDNASTAIEMKFKKSSISPLNTYRTQEEDLLKSLSAILSKTDPEEQVFIQIVLKRIGTKPWERGLNGLIYQLTAKKFGTDGSPTPTYSKFSQDLFRGKLRVTYIAKDKAEAQSKLKGFIGIFKSLKARTNELKKSGFRLINDLDTAFKARAIDTGDFWTPAELATIYHFPYKGTVVSNVVTETSKRAPAPDILPKEGLVSPDEVSYIGATNYRNENKVFGIKRFDRRRHLYIVGKTGGGKSKLLELLLISDIKSGQGCCLLDPHGDLAEEILKFIPKDRIKDVVYINPADRDYPIGFNPLEPVDDYQTRQHLCTFFISIFKKLFAATWNQRMEHLIR